MGLGGGLSDLLRKVTDDGGVGVEEVITGHARLARNASGDDDDLSTFQGTGEVVGGVALDLLETKPNEVGDSDPVRIFRPT